jgi:hypothetical protein
MLHETLQSYINAYSDLEQLKCHTGLTVVKTCELPSNNMLFIQSSNKIEQIGQQGGRDRHTNNDTITASLSLQDT